MNALAKQMAIGAWSQNLIRVRANLNVSLSHLDQALAEGRFYPEMKAHEESIQDAHAHIRAALACLAIEQRAPDLAPRGADLAPLPETNPNPALENEQN